MREKEESSYRFYNSVNVLQILQKHIKKIGIYEFDRRKGKEEKRDWYYISSEFAKNPLLIFGKFIPYTSIEKEENENKEKYLRLVISELTKLLSDTKLLEKISNRIYFVLERLQKEGYEVERVDNLTCSWRLIIGLGASHPQETSMTLHYLYGIPYIPGSAVKGATRHWAVLKFAEKYWKSIKPFVKDKENKGKFEDSIKTVAEALEKSDDLNIEVDEITFKELIEIFGTQKQQGKLIFFDAYPVGNINLKIDIMNPHYPKYYSEGQPPTDWQNPLPINFLTVENTKFQFYLLSKNKNLLSITKKLLKEALLNYGIGAKTSIGYGVFKDFF